MNTDTKKIVTILALIFFYPLGLILMWVWMTWSKTVKILVTLPLVLFILSFVIAFMAGFFSALIPKERYNKGHVSLNVGKAILKRVMNTTRA